jgi:hypothetical protein
MSGYCLDSEAIETLSLLLFSFERLEDDGARWRANR